MPQAPQLFGLAAMSVSQPLPGSPSQSPLPARQPTPHTPPAQVASTPGGTGQALPHPPQFFASAAMFASQPLAASLSQSAKPRLHGPRTQLPAAQPGSALGSGAHTLPQLPQLLALVAVSTQPPLQQAPGAPPVPAGHSAASTQAMVQK